MGHGLSDETKHWSNTGVNLTSLMRLVNGTYMAGVSLACLMIPSNGIWLELA